MKEKSDDYELERKENKKSTENLQNELNKYKED